MGIMHLQGRGDYSTMAMLQGIPVAENVELVCRICKLSDDMDKFNRTMGNGDDFDSPSEASDAEDD